ncbi:MAG: FecR domain-containing protein [Steroidobacteraceae bacterium]
MTDSEVMTEARRAERRERAAEQAAESLLVPPEAMSPQQRAELVDWLCESPVHVAEMLRVSRVHAALQVYRGWEQHSPDCSAPAASVLEFRSRTPEVQQGTNRGHRRMTWAAAAALVMMLVGAAWLMLRSGPMTLQTLPGERRELTLADGSVVDLAPASELKVRLGVSERSLWLVRGEAFFHVRKDPRRPFVVAVDDMHVRAVGTAFGVRREGQGAVVTVLEGRVSVSNRLTGAAVQAPDSAVLVGANEQLRIAQRGVSPGPVRHVDATAESAWTSGELVFDDQPVEEVVRRFNAYNRTQIIIDDPQLGERRVSGVFRTSDPESFVSFLQSVVDLSTVRVDDRRIHIGVADHSAAAAP